MFAAAIAELDHKQVQLGFLQNFVDYTLAGFEIDRQSTEDLASQGSVFDLPQCTEEKEHVRKEGLTSYDMREDR